MLPSFVTCNALSWLVLFYKTLLAFTAFNVLVAAIVDAVLVAKEVAHYRYATNAPPPFLAARNTRYSKSRAWPWMSPTMTDGKGTRTMFASVCNSSVVRISISFISATYGKYYTSLSKCLYNSIKFSYGFLGIDSIKFYCCIALLTLDSLALALPLFTLSLPSPTTLPPPTLLILLILLSLLLWSESYGSLVLLSLSCDVTLVLLLLSLLL